MNTYNFAKADLTQTSKSIDIRPINYPITVGTGFMFGDIVTSSVSPFSCDLVPDIYEFEYDDRSEWFVNVSGSTVSVVSGSNVSSSCLVTFQPLDVFGSASCNTEIIIEPLWKNVVFNSGSYSNYFIQRDSLRYFTDATGNLAVRFVSMPYKIYVLGKIKNPEPTVIWPTGSAANFNDIKVTFNRVSTVPTITNNSNAAWPKDVSDGRYARSGSGGSSVSASYALTSSNVSGNNVTILGNTVTTTANNIRMSGSLIVSGSQIIEGTLNVNKVLKANSGLIVNGATETDGLSTSSDLYLSGSILDYNTGEDYVINSSSYSSTASYSPVQLPDITDDTVNRFIGINQLTPACELDVNGVIGNSSGPLKIDNFGASVTTIGDIDNQNGGAVLNIDGTEQTFSFISGSTSLDTGRIFTDGKGNVFINQSGSYYPVSMSLDSQGKFQIQYKGAYLKFSRFDEILLQHTNYGGIHIAASDITLGRFDSNAFFTLRSDGSSHWFDNSFSGISLDGNNGNVLIGSVLTPSENRLDVAGNISCSVITASLNGSASYATKALSASYISASGVIGTVANSVNATSATTAIFSTSAGSVSGTASYANKALSASYAPQTIVTTVPSASWASQSLSASYITASGIVGTVLSSSFSSTASYFNARPYTTVLTSSANYITASLLNNDQYVNITTGGAYNFTCSNMPVAGYVADTSVFINNTATATSSVSFPANWIFLGSYPTQLTSSKNAVLSLKAYGSQVVAAFSVQY